MLFVWIMLLFFFIDLRKCFLFSCFVFVYLFFLFASCTVLLICLFFLIICSHRCCFFIYFFFYFLWKGYELSGEIALKNNHYYYYYLLCQSYEHGTLSSHWTHALVCPICKKARNLSQWTTSLCHLQLSLAKLWSIVLFPTYVLI